MLKRQPQVVLVDELAHTNTPGSKNPKRWQDVEELLDAGITVISTVNVQHLESLNDVVAQITGIEQQEKVPDEVVRAADQIELVDITPEALRRRLAHGNVYAPERIDAALSNYFRRGNLTALRELALLWLADQVDAALEKYREENKITDTWEARERVVVAVTGGPESETLVRRASRIASKSSAELMVVHVVRGDGLVGRLGPADGQGARAGHQPRRHPAHRGRRRRANRATGFRPRENATQLVIGTSRRSRWARIFDEGIGAAVVQQSGKIDVHMVTHDGGQARILVVDGSHRGSATPRPGLPPLWFRPPSVRSSSFCSTRFLGIGGESAIFFIGVLVVALLGGVAPAALSALLSGLLLNYFLVEPRYTFTIAEPDSAVTVVVLLLGRRRGRRARRRCRQPRPRSQAGVAGGRVAGVVRRVGAARSRPRRHCWSGSGRRTRNGRSACCDRDGDSDGAGSSAAWARTRASTSTPPIPRSRSATTSSGC